MKTLQVINKSKDDNLRFIHKDQLIDIQHKSLITGWNLTVHTDPIIEYRIGGQFAGKAFYLDPNYDWYLGYDSDLGKPVILVPLKKGSHGQKR